MSWKQIFLRFAIRTHQKNEYHKLLIERPISINKSLHQLELLAFNFKKALFANNSKKNCYKQISFTFRVSSANFTSTAKAMPVSLKKNYNFFSLQFFFLCLCELDSKMLIGEIRCAARLYLAAFGEPMAPAFWFEQWRVYYLIFVYFFFLFILFVWFSRIWVCVFGGDGVLRVLRVLLALLTVRSQCLWHWISS